MKPEHRPRVFFVLSEDASRELGFPPSDDGLYALSEDAGRELGLPLHGEAYFILSEAERREFGLQRRGDCEHDTASFDDAAAYADLSEAGDAIATIARRAPYATPDNFEELRSLLNAAGIIGRDIARRASAGLESC
jgi:hypothetical protein